MSLSSEYVSISDQPSESSESKQDQLLILDLNGTLCDRGKSKVSFYTRPHCKTFFDYIFQNYTVMVWSSAQVHSVERMCNMFDPYKPGLTWDRSHFNLSEKEFYTKSETLKDLNLVWDISDDFNATNTIIIDDTPRKLLSQPYNLMLMSTFKHTSFETDNDLLKAIAYLKYLRCQTNVANYMKENPFDVESQHGVEVDPVKDKYVGYYIKGIWNNPPEKVLVTKAKKPSKKKRKRKAAAAAALLESNDSIKLTKQDSANTTKMPESNNTRSVPNNESPTLVQVENRTPMATLRSIKKPRKKMKRREKKIMK